MPLHAVCDCVCMPQCAVCDCACMPLRAVCDCVCMHLRAVCDCMHAPARGVCVTVLQDLSPLAACTWLQVLHVHSTLVEHLGPLAACTGLVEVTCDCSMPLEQIQRLQAACGHLEVTTRWSGVGLLEGEEEEAEEGAGCCQCGQQCATAGGEGEAEDVRTSRN